MCLRPRSSGNRRVSAIIFHERTNTTIQASCFNLSKSTTLFTKNTHQTQESQIPVTPIWSLKLFTKKSFDLVERKPENYNHQACSVRQHENCWIPELISGYNLLKKPLKTSWRDSTNITTKLHRFIKAITWLITNTKTTSSLLML